MTLDSYAAKLAAEKRKFISKLAKTTPSSCELAVGDSVVVRNGFGFILDAIKIVGFAKNPDKYDNIVYLDWDCYWVAKNLHDVWKPDTQRDFIASVYSVPQPLPHRRQYDVVIDWGDYQNEADRQFLDASKMIFSWSKCWDIQNIMAQLYFEKKRRAADECDYYQENGYFGNGSTVSLTADDLDEIAKFEQFHPFLQIARSEIEKGNTLYYRAF